MPSRQACISIGLFVFFSLTTVGDFIMDWLFYKEVSTLEKGLVYGETNPHAVKALLAFSIIGTAAFLVELVNLAYELYTNEKESPWIDSDILSLLVLWFEDLPQISISLYLAICREEGISTIQLTKASATLVEMFIRCCISLVKVCRKKVHNHHIKIKAAIAVASVIELGFAAAIFTLNNTDRSGQFKIPRTLTEDTYDDSQYFTNVSVFINMPQYFDARNLDPCKKDAVVNWVQLTSVTNIRASSQNSQPILFSFQFENIDTDTMKMAVWEKSNSIWPSPKCFVAHLTSGLVSQELTTTCGSKGYFGNSSTEAFVQFRFDPPTGLFRNRIFGQIFFNMKIFEHGICKDVDRYSELLPGVGDKLETVVMHYYRINLSLSGNQEYLLQTGTASVRFFSNDELDLTDVTEAWKTGWGKCSTTGSLGPVLDPSIDLQCNRS